MDMINYLPRNVLQVLSNTDNSGRVKWSQSLFANEVAKMRSYSKEDLACYMFGMTRLYNYKVGFITDNYLENLNPKIEFYKDKPNLMFLSADTNTFCGLPLTANKEERNELHRFLNRLKKTYNDFYEKFPNCFMDIHLTISDKNGSLLDCFEVSGLGNENEKEYKFYWDEKIIEMRERIKASKTLFAWFIFNHKMVLKSKFKNKMTFSSSCFFDDRDNPVLLRWKEECKQEEAQRAADDLVSLRKQAELLYGAEFVKKYPQKKWNV